MESLVKQLFRDYDAAPLTMIEYLRRLVAGSPSSKSPFENRNFSSLCLSLCVDGLGAHVGPEGPNVFGVYAAEASAAGSGAMPTLALI